MCIYWVPYSDNSSKTIVQKQLFDLFDYLNKQLFENYLKTKTNILQTIGLGLGLGLRLSVY